MMTLLGTITYPLPIAGTFESMIFLFTHVGYVCSQNCYKNLNPGPSLAKKGTSWWFWFFFENFHPYLGKIPILTNIFQMGWNHQELQLLRLCKSCTRRVKALMLPLKTSVLGSEDAVMFLYFLTRWPWLFIGFLRIILKLPRKKHGGWCSPKGWFGIRLFQAIRPHVCVGLHPKGGGNCLVTNCNTKSIQHSGRCTGGQTFHVFSPPTVHAYTIFQPNSSSPGHRVEVVIPVSVREHDLDLLRFHSKAGILEVLLSCQMMVIWWWMMGAHFVFNNIEGQSRCSDT